ncbi:MAG TPA: hypothetical protein VE569_05015 [Acidimicrobiia bacterium]|jgi:hypothetical protein|nr:hypothetical protein [Acidimicrobiia bacterium]
MKKHSFDPLSFIVGILATGLGLAFLIMTGTTKIFGIIDDLGSWFWPAVLVLIGAAILAPLIPRRADDERDVEEDS